VNFEENNNKKKYMSSQFIHPVFNKKISNKVSKFIDVADDHTLIVSDPNADWRSAIAQDEIDVTNFEGNIAYALRIDSSSNKSTTALMVGFTPQKNVSSSKECYFAANGFSGCGFFSTTGDLWVSVASGEDERENDAIESLKKICKNAKEIIVVLSLSNNGETKHLQFVVEGKVSPKWDCSEQLRGSSLCPAICIKDGEIRVTTISIDHVRFRAELESILGNQKEEKSNEKSRTNKTEKKAMKEGKKNAKKETNASKK
jgi:hypothetical protein